MPVATLEELYIRQLKELYSAETQLIAALPKMIRAAHDKELKLSFETHLDETREHAERLKRILEEFDEQTTGHPCEAMAGLIREGSRTIEENAPAVIKDAALIAAAQRVEHYEIASYGCARTYAKLLGDEETAEILQLTLDEEADADQLLTETAEQLDVEAGVCCSRG